MRSQDETKQLKAKAIETYREVRSLAQVCKRLNIAHSTIMRWMREDSDFAERKRQIDEEFRNEMVEIARQTVLMSLIGQLDETGSYYLIKPRPDIAMRLLELYGATVGFTQSVEAVQNKAWLEYLDKAYEAKSKS